MKNYKLALLTLLFCGELFAGSGSRYSRFGLGDLMLNNSARRLGFGELGIALSDDSYLGNLNPASLNKLNFTRFETGISYSGTSISDNTSSVFHSNTTLNGITLAFPIEHDYGISMSLGFSPYSNVDYNLINTGSDPLVGDNTSQFTGTGGITKYFVGASYKLPFDFSLGASIDYYSGQISNSVLIKFSNTNNYSNAEFSNIHNYHGLGFTFGIISNDFSKYFGDTKFSDFRLGALFSTSAELNTDTLYNLSTVVGEIESESGTVKTNLPYRLGVGASIKYDKDFTFLIDYLIQPFSEFTFNTKPLNNLKDYSKISLGVEYHKADIRTNAFWEQVALRGGLSFEQAPLTFEGTDIRQLSFYAGFSFPISYENTLDLGFQYGMRGKKGNNLLNENIFRFSVNLSIGELWFYRPER